MSTPSFSAAVERYRDHLHHVQERRPTTIAAYSGVLWDWYGWLDRRGKTWDRATTTDAGRWLQRPTRSGRARGVRIGANTRMHYLNALRGFYGWAERERLISRGRNPTAGLVAKGAPPVPRSLPVADLRTALVAAEHDTRLEVMVALAYFAGLRAGEVSRARIEHVHFGDQPFIAVDGKGRPTPACPAASRV
jgi:site-specific recombinase XerD